MKNFHENIQSRIVEEVDDGTNNIFKDKQRRLRFSAVVQSTRQRSDTCLMRCRLSGRLAVCRSHAGSLPLRSGSPRRWHTSSPWGQAWWQLLGQKLPAPLLTPEAERGDSPVAAGRCWWVLNQIQAGGQRVFTSIHLI